MGMTIDSFFIKFHGIDILGEVKKGGIGFIVYLNGIPYKSFATLTEIKNFCKKMQDSPHNTKYYADLSRISKFKRHV